MVKKKSESDILFHLARLGLESRKEDLLVYLKRIAKTVKGSDLESYTKLLKLVETHQSNATSFRGMKNAPTPVDLETRLELVRLSSNSLLKFEPIWQGEVKQKLDQIVNERKQQKGLLKQGLTPTKAVIFTGKPGVGKSLAAKWLASNLRYPLLTLDLSAVMSSLLGRTGTNLRSVLDYAKSFECVLLLDEIDSIAKKRDDNSDVGELKRLVTVILQEIEEWPASGLLIAATNHPNLLDPAVWRRFDLSIDFPLPNAESLREAIVMYLGTDAKIEANLILALSKLFEGYSYNDVERTLLRIRKRAVLDKKSLSDALLEYLIQSVDEMEKNEKVDFSKLLLDLGFSQRKASDITGISRDTIRKKLSE